MSHHVFFEMNGGERIAQVAAYELSEGGWITLIDAGSGSVQTVPAHAVNRVVLDLDETDTATVEGGMNHVIHFVDGARTDVDGIVLASGYEIQEGWLLYVNAITGETELCPAHTVAAVDVDLSNSM